MKKLNLLILSVISFQLFNFICASDGVIAQEDLDQQLSNIMETQDIWHDPVVLQNIKSLLDRGANVNKDWRQAIMNGSLAVIKLFLAHGADVNAMDDEYSSPPLYRAACGNRLDVAKLLLDNGANVDIKMYDGRTPLCCVTWVDNAFNEQRTATISVKGDLAMAKLLIDHGANVNGYGHSTPLFLAASFDNPAVVKLLLDRGATNIDAQVAFGATALCNAARLGYLEVVQLLLSHGADKTIRDDDGKTAEQLAKNEEIARVIRDYQVTN